MPTKFTNSTPTPEDHGGIPAGSTFDELDLTQKWNDVLYPYYEPEFTSFDIDVLPGAYEIGYTIPAGPQFFKWATSYNENIQDGTFSIHDQTDSLDLATGLDNDGVETITLPNDIQHTVVESHTWQIRGLNSKGDTFSKNHSIQWREKNYWGSDADGDITEDDILAGSNGLDTKGSGDYTVADSGYKWLSYPSSYGYASRIIDKNTGFDVAMDPAWNPKIVSVTNSYGILTDLYVYRSMNVINVL